MNPWFHRVTTSIVGVVVATIGLGLLTGCEASDRGLPQYEGGGRPGTSAATFASGAQWVSTDFPEPRAAARFTSQYVVRLADGASARCNPITPAHVEGTCTAVPIP